METLVDGMEEYQGLERNAKKLKRMVNTLKALHHPVFFFMFIVTLLGSGPCCPFPQPPN